MQKPFPRLLQSRPALVAAGLLLGLLAVEMLLRLSALALSARQAAANLSAARREGVYKVLCIGESTTFMQYPRFLEQELNANASGLRFAVIDAGAVGITTPGIIDSLPALLDKCKPDLAVSMMGVNDTGTVMPRPEDGGPAHAFLLRHLRVYKLLRLALLHLSGPRPASCPPCSAKAGAQCLLGQGRLLEDGENFAGARSCLELAVGREPRNPRARLALGRLLASTEQYEASAAELLKAQELDPSSGEIAREQAQVYASLGRWNDAFAALDRAEKTAPKNELAPDRAYLYLRKGDAAMARRLFLAMPRNNPMALSGLGQASRALGDFKGAEKYFMQAANSGDAENWNQLGLYYKDRNENAKAEAAFRKAIALNPQDHWGWLDLGLFLKKLGRPDEAAHCFLRAIDVKPDSDIALGALATLYLERGDSSRAREYYARAEALRGSSFNPVTVASYRALKAELDRRGIRYACMQYPMRSIQPLKRLFAGESGVIFIDNEAPFKEGVARDGYYSLFRDIFGGDFGHCTEQGNRLIARNAAQAVLKALGERPGK